MNSVERGRKKFHKENEILIFKYMKYTFLLVAHITTIWDVLELVGISLLMFFIGMGCLWVFKKNKPKTRENINYDPKYFLLRNTRNIGIIHIFGSILIFIAGILYFYFYLNQLPIN